MRMRTAKALIRLGRYKRLLFGKMADFQAEFSLGTQSLCWFCHEAAKM